MALHRHHTLSDTDNAATLQEGRKMAKEDKRIIENIANILVREKDITYEEHIRILELLQQEGVNG